jgi:RNA polymerase sigma-70 factor, ECF subfamily
METIAVNDASNRVDLVNRIRAGDRQAEVELVERYSRGVIIIIRREARDKEVAEGIYQDVFRIVLEKIRQGDVRQPERLSGFVCSVARNHIISYYRRAARHESNAEIEELTSPAHPAPDQLQELSQKEKADLIRKFLREMPNEREIQALYRFYIANDDREQICADLGLTIPHFNTVLHRAHGRFRELYERAARDK